MERRTTTVATLMAAFMISGSFALEACAQRSSTKRMAYNPVTGKTERDTRYEAQLPSPSYRTDDVQYFAPSGEVQQASYCDCGNEYCDGCPDACGCGDPACCAPDCCEPVCCDSVCGGPCQLGPRRWYTGFEATFVKPYFGSNAAFTTTDNVGTNSTISETDFDYDMEFSPRVFLGWNRDCGDVGFRATWWQFDHSASTAQTNPPSSGLGNVALPEFGDVVIESAVPENIISAESSLNAYTVDLEATKTTNFCSWQFGMSGGFRYAYIEQGYLGTLSDDSLNALDQIDFSHSIEGFGPTIGFEAFRPHGCRSGMFCKARGSILFGDSQSSLVADQDISLTTPSRVTQATASDDILSICELQVGYRWQADPRHCRGVQPFYSLAMEGQLWDGAGNASSQDGTLGFFGFNSAIGLNW